jgi:hypothetical protein
MAAILGALFFGFFPDAGEGTEAEGAVEVDEKSAGG